MLNDDLVPLLGPGDQPVLGFRQGTVVSWNADTGENTIDVAGAQLVNVPILNTGEAIALKAGHVVALLTFNNTFWIMGRITVPGGSDFASASVAFGSAGASATNFAIVQTTMTTIATATMSVPPWVDEALVLGIVSASVENPRAVVDYANIRAVVNGAAGGATSSSFAPLAAAQGGDRLMLLATVSQRLQSPGATITVDGQMSTFGAAWTARAVNILNVEAIGVFRSTT